MLELYIEGQKVDSSKQLDIPITYKTVDLSNPQAIKNDYSKTVTIEGTPNNNRIFGHIFEFNRNQLDSDILTGIHYNPNKRAKYTIIEDGNTFSHGYVKLDAITKTKGIITYSLTLFGGLGNFFYNLMYIEEDGDERNLSSLYYNFNDLTKDEENTQSLFELDNKFTIECWNNRFNDNVYGNKLTQVLCPIPCYNGYYDDFDSDKFIINKLAYPEACAGKDLVIDDDTYYSSKANWLLCNTTRELSEWEVNDIRSHYQRIGMRLGFIYDAIKNPDNNGGYIVDDSNIDDIEKEYIKNMYLTFDPFDYEEVTKSSISDELVFTPTQDNCKKEDESIYGELDFNNRNMMSETMKSFDSDTVDITNYISTNGTVDIIPFFKCRPNFTEHANAKNYPASLIFDMPVHEGKVAFLPQPNRIGDPTAAVSYGCGLYYAEIYDNGKLVRLSNIYIVGLGIKQRNILEGLVTGDNDKDRQQAINDLNIYNIEYMSPYDNTPLKTFGKAWTFMKQEITNYLPTAFKRKYSGQFNYGRDFVMPDIIWTYAISDYMTSDDGDNTILTPAQDKDMVNNSISINLKGKLDITSNNLSVKLKMVPLTFLCAMNATVDTVGKWYFVPGQSQWDTPYDITQSELRNVKKADWPYYEPQPFNYWSQYNKGKVFRWFTAQMKNNPASFNGCLAVCNQYADFLAPGAKILGTSKIFDGETSSVSESHVFNKTSLLSNTESPYKYLTSLGKMFNWKFECDRYDDIIHIYSSKNYFKNQRADYNKLVDYNNYKIKPTTAEYHNYKFGFEDVETYASTLWSTKYDEIFGEHIFNTGYGFNKESKAAIDDVVFRIAVPYRLRSVYFNNITEPTYCQPMLGDKYTITLWYETNDEQNTLDKTYYGYYTKNPIDQTTQDNIPKLCCFDDEYSTVDFENMIVLYNKKDTDAQETKDYYISNNAEVCNELNESNCYILAKDKTVVSSIKDAKQEKLAIKTNKIPVFSNHFNFKDTDYYIQYDVNPKTVDYVDGANVSLWDLCYSSYIADLYNMNTKQLEIKTKLLEHPKEALRQFYEIDGNLWMLNEITNYKPGYAQYNNCTFIKANSILNYTS